MEFLLRSRTAEGHEELLHRLVSCSCKIFDYGKQPPATLQPLECFDLFISHLCDMLVGGLSELRPAKFRSRKPNRAARRQPWPNCVADIGLHDTSAEDLLYTLLRWNSAPPIGAGLFVLIGSLARFWSPIGQELLTCRPVIRSMRATLISSKHFFEFPVPPQSVDFFRRAVRSCHILWTDLHFVDTEHTVKFPEWTDGLYDAAAVVIPLLAKHSPQLDKQREWLSALLLRKNYTVPEALIHRDSSTQSTNGDYFQARYEMTITMRRRTCMHLNCPIDPETPVATTLSRLCAQCGVVSYCSTSCHRAAWTAESCPHKDVCLAIARVREKLGLGRPRPTPLRYS
ncbi:hypothetical protein C8R46DRAFT_184354 [Mycena filopes]|nr:hypothetical protein C8R46DRAFT_184354 [Mycena filopes]